MGLHRVLETGRDDKGVGANLRRRQLASAPELVDDYYLNVLDWGQSSNVLAVALGAAVYLWNAGSGDRARVLRAGGLQEAGHRAGTEDVAGIAALSAALVECEQKHVVWESQRLGWRERFERELVAALPGTRIVAAGADRLWNTVFAVMPHTEHSRWIARLDKRDVQVSTGAACTTGRDSAAA
jgi:cysteine sulfinate desulfinase/cysteine desulfurase-like protein